jgi:phospholipid/cholesterol/gamma-HCH transport system ATP-binding protein
MIGLYKPKAGRVLVAGKDISRAEGKERLAILRRIGVMYQGGALFGSQTLLENVRLPLEEHTGLPRHAMDLVAKLKLQMVGLEGNEDLMPAELSGGMIKRAAIARAMSLDPQILFLDEPGAGLDPITATKLDRLIVRLAESLGITFVIVTHEIHSVLSIGDWMLLLDKKTKGIVVAGPPKEVAGRVDLPLVRRFFRRDEEDEEQVEEKVEEQQEQQEEEREEREEEQPAG